MREEEDYSSHSSESPSSEHVLNIAEFKSLFVHRDYATSADLHIPFYFTSRTHLYLSRLLTDYI